MCSLEAPLMPGVNGLPKSTLPELFGLSLIRGGGGKHYIVFKRQLEGKSAFKLKMFAV